MDWFVLSCVCVCVLFSLQQTSPIVPYTHNIQSRRPLSHLRPTATVGAPLPSSASALLVFFGGEVGRAAAKAIKTAFALHGQPRLDSSE